MGYRNAQTVLPPALLSALQQYVEGECLYIPRREHRPRASSSAELLIRNEAIWLQYQNGCSVQQLSESYYLSPQAIYKILSKFR